MPSRGILWKIKSKSAFPVSFSVANAEIDLIGYLLIYTLGFLYIISSGSANAKLPGFFRPWTFSLNIGLNMFPLDSFMSCLQSLLGYSTGEFQPLQLIVLAAFGAVD